MNVGTTTAMAMNQGLIAGRPAAAGLRATLLMGADGVLVTPQVVVAVAVAFVLTHTLPAPGPRTETVAEAG